MARRPTRFESAQPTADMPSRIDPDMEDDAEVSALNVEVFEDDEGERSDSGIEYRENDDGTVDVIYGDEEGGEAGEFDDNLAEVLDQSFLDTAARNLIQAVERDREARKKRDEQYAEGLKRSGLGEDAPGGADFEGANKVAHPALTEACVDFAADASKELLPPGGPVKTHIFGEATLEQHQRAERKRKHMNWQLTVEMPEYYPEMEQLLTQVPMGGSQYLKVYRDFAMKRNRAEFVPIDYVFVPFNATDFDTAPRKTHMLFLNEHEYASRVNSGMYRKVENSRAGDMDDRSESDEANDPIEGREYHHNPDDGDYTIYEIQCYYECPDDEFADNEGGEHPYIISIDVESGTILSWYRNWEEGDPTYAPLAHMVEFSFIPWRGAYGIGLPHLIGGLSAASTGSLRALLDSAMVNNMPTAVRLKGSRTAGQSVRMNATQVAEIEGPPDVDDIRKVLMPMPFNPPSVVLMELLKFLDVKTKGVVSTASEKLDHLQTNTPVGTAQMQVEDGSKIYRSIHARLHRAQRKVFQIIHRLNATYMDDQQIIQALNNLQISREDYVGPVDIAPVSDPNIYSEAQRYTQMQALNQLSAQHPDLYDQYAIQRRTLEQLRIPDIDEVLPPPKGPEPQNPLAENNAMAMGQPAMAFPDQDHLAHIQVHLDFFRVMRQMFPTFAVQIVEVLLEHIKQHVVGFYVSNVINAVSNAAGEDITQIPTKEIEAQNELSQALAAGSQQAMNAFIQAMQGVPPIIAEALQLLEEFRPDTTDPAVQASLQIAQGEQQVDMARVEADRERARMEHQQRMVSDRAKAAMEAAKLLQDERESKRDAEVDLETNEADNLTRLEIARMRERGGGNAG